MYARGAALLRAAANAAAAQKGESAQGRLEKLAGSFRQEARLALTACGGTLPWPADAKLIFETQQRGAFAGMAFDDAAGVQANVQQLLAAASPAPFGRGKELVYDDSYRRALVVDPSRFVLHGWSLETHGMPLLHDVHRLLAPEFSGVRAELYKLNVYRPGDYFKPHVDTLRQSKNRDDVHFASLVVTLPLAHSGGELVLRGPTASTCSSSSGGTRTTTFDLSHRAPSAEQPLLLRWAAFYTDIEHELLPVTDGTRLSLTYNIYGTKAHLTHEQQATVQLVSLKQLQAAVADGRVNAAPAAAPASAADATPIAAAARADGAVGIASSSGTATTPVSVLPSVAGAVAAVNHSEVTAALRDLLASPLCLPLGGTLLYHCQHHYPIHTDALQGGDGNFLPSVLKGCDATYLAAAAASGLPWRIAPVLRDQNNRWGVSARQLQPVLRIPAVPAAARQHDPRPTVVSHWDDRKPDLNLEAQKVAHRDRLAHCARVAALVDYEQQYHVSDVRVVMSALPGVSELTAAVKELYSSKVGALLGDPEPIPALQECTEADIDMDDWVEYETWEEVLRGDSLPVCFTPTPLVAVNTWSDRANCVQFGRTVCGNQPAEDQYTYSVAAVVIRVPAWQKREAKMA